MFISLHVKNSSANENVKVFNPFPLLTDTPQISSNLWVHFGVPMVLFIDADAPGSWREKWVAIQKHLRAAPRRQGLVWLWIVVVELPGSCPS